MTAEQLEELLGKVLKLKSAETYEKIMNSFPGPPIVEYLCRDNVHLTRRVIAAEKLVEALKNAIDALKYGAEYAEGNWVVSEGNAALTAYREASK